MKSFNAGIVMMMALVMAAPGFMSCSSNSAKLISLKVAPAEQVIVSGIQMEAAGEFSNMATLNFTSEVLWSSSNPAVATIGTIAGKAGYITVLSTGTTTITAVEPFNHFTSSSLLTVVTPSAITITPENPVMKTKEFHDFVAIATFVNPYTAATMTQSLISVSSPTSTTLVSSLTWTTSDSNLATATKRGLVTTGTTTGQVDIIASFTIDPVNIPPVSGTMPLTVVSGRLLKITVTPDALSLSLSGLSVSQALTATGDYDDSTTLDLTTSVEWLSSHTGMVVVSNETGSKGLATAVGVGKATIKATDPVSKITGIATVTVIP